MEDYIQLTEAQEATLQVIREAELDVYYQVTTLDEAVVRALSRIVDIVEGVC